MELGLVELELVDRARGLTGCQHSSLHPSSPSLPPSPSPSPTEHVFFAYLFCSYPKLRLLLDDGTDDGEGGRGGGRVYMAMEKRFNFELESLSEVAHG